MDQLFYLEFVLSAGFLVLIGMELQGHFAICLLDLVVAGSLGDAEDLVVVLAHSAIE